MKSVELLAPAGDLQRLQTALYFGADAVYVGGKNFGLRAGAVNFTDEELTKAVQIVHDANKKIYVTVNIFARNRDFEKLVSYVKFLEKINVDAVIVSDLGVIKIVREHTNLTIHVSTQANVMNKFTATEYVRLGATRIVLARECDIQEIREIAEFLKGKCEIEVFVHGAMCMSYSGRCLLSNYLSRGNVRESNRGECNQPCRWKYALVEETRPNVFMPIEQDDRGAYILNSRDLCLVNHLRELANAGVTSFKIEGRVKTEYYVASTVNTYRRVIDEKCDFDPIVELEKSAHRHFTTGFVFGDKDCEYSDSSQPVQSHEFTAIVRHSATSDGIYTVEMRNAFNVGDELEILSPSGMFNKTFKILKIINSDCQEITRANKPMELLKINCPHAVNSGDILRRKILPKSK